MTNHAEHNEDEELTEILKLAVRMDGSSTASLRERLTAAAGELGISPEAVAQAEFEYRQESARKQELALYAKESSNALRIHLGVFIIGSVFFVGLNLLTFGEDKELWFPYIFLTWGFGLAIHAFVALRKVDWDNDEFQKWRRKRAADD